MKHFSITFGLFAVLGAALGIVLGLSAFDCTSAALFFGFVGLVLDQWLVGVMMKSSRWVTVCWVVLAGAIIGMATALPIWAVALLTAAMALMATETFSLIMGGIVFAVIARKELKNDIGSDEKQPGNIEDTFDRVYLSQGLAP